jgi:plastocyanin
MMMFSGINPPRGAQEQCYNDRPTNQRRKMNKLPKILVLALSVALLLTACGGGGATIKVTITDFAYTPSTFTVPAGAQVTLNATNNGAVEHEFAIMKLGTSVTPPFGDKDEGNIFWELDEIQAGTTKSATFTAPTEPGDYQIVCGLAGHIEQGMVGKLTVK